MKKRIEYLIDVGAAIGVWVVFLGGVYFFTYAVVNL